MDQVVCGVYSGQRRCERLSIETVPLHDLGRGNLTGSDKFRSPDQTAQAYRFVCEPGAQATSDVAAGAGEKDERALIQHI